MIKGKTVKDETDLATLGLKDGVTIMLMGTASGKEFVAPTEKTLFYEDLTPEQRVTLLKEKTGEILPAGLINLGNTCYMNSSMQCFKKVKELKDIIATAPPKQDADSTLAKTTGLLFTDLESKGDSFAPAQFV